MAVKIDLLDGNRGRLTQSGWEFDRIAIITGVANWAPYEKLIRAGEQLAAQGINIGQIHPKIPTARLIEAEGEAIDNDKVKFRLIYRDPIITTAMEVGGSLSQVETTIDAFSNDIWSSYSFPVGHDLNPNGPDPLFVKQGGFVSKTLPEHHITITRTELGNPSYRAKIYLGAVNSGPWTLDKNAAPRTWLCTQLSGTSEDGGYSYSVTYSFQYRADTWDEWSHFIDPTTGKPPWPDTFSPGDQPRKRWQVCRMANFNYLGLNY